MQELTITPSTIVVLIVLAAVVVWAVYRIVHRGLCDCHDQCGNACSGCASKSTSKCKHCSVAEDTVDKMAARMDKADTARRDVSDSAHL